ncbi:MAG: 16S rRNA (cytosine(967)-C(5))-methyltransferase RsmB [Oscillospiraceae bacterium]
MENARTLAVKLLLRTFAKGGYSNILVDKSLKESPLSEQDKRLCSLLYYGTMERLLTLQYIASVYSSRPLKDLDESVRYILYLGLYQLLYCEKIPERAAVHETVELCQAFRKKSASGFVNAVLREFLRKQKAIPPPENLWKSREIEYSAPMEFICKVWEEQGEQFAKAFFENSLQKPPVTIRLNHIRAKPEMIPDLQEIPESPIKNAYYLNVSDISGMQEFQKGYFHVQDLAPQICCQLLNPQKGETILDVCASPGGKTFTIAEMMENQGRVEAFDLHPNRVKLILQGAKRLGLDCIHAEVQDAKQFRADMPTADRILCDVPCSGLGVIRRKPEIKYKPLETFADLPEIQYAILENSAKYLKKGGILVYATCTILKAENENVIERFLNAHPEFSLLPFTELNKTEGYMTFTAEYANCDGFFVARLCKEG